VSPSGVSQDVSLVGFAVHGRHGTLGVVVTPDRFGAPDVSEAHELLVIGGRSSLLHLHIPRSLIADVSIQARTVDVDLDVVDFTAHVADDGSIQLHVNG
jgi:hypothetical protein